MVRWEPNARGRLEVAAMELYIERGFEQTTVAEIAKRAGLTERTFFRYFADKREVLFDGSGALLELMVSVVTGAPAATTPIDAVGAAAEAAGAMIQQRRDYSLQRQSVIVANPDLRERELIKLAVAGRGPRRCPAPARRRRSGREPHCRGRHRRLQDRIRALDRPLEHRRLRDARARITRRTQGRDRRPLARSSGGPSSRRAVDRSSRPATAVNGPAGASAAGASSRAWTGVARPARCRRRVPRRGRR